MRKTSSFFARAEDHPCFSEQGTQIATISAFLARFWSTLCGFCASPQKRPRTNGDVLPSRTYTNAVQFVSVLGPSGCEVLGVGPWTSGIQRFGRVCALPVFHFFANIRITRGLNFFSKTALFVQSFLDLRDSRTIGVHFSAWAMLTLFTMVLRLWRVENNTTGILV